MTRKTKRKKIIVANGRRKKKKSNKVRRLNDFVIEEKRQNAIEQRCSKN